MIDAAERLLERQILSLAIALVGWAEAGADETATMALRFAREVIELRTRTRTQAMDMEPTRQPPEPDRDPRVPRFIERDALWVDR